MELLGEICRNDTERGKPSISGLFSGKKQGFWNASSTTSERTQICRISASTALTSKLTIGASRGGRSTRIHAVVDALGNPIHVQLSAGNVHDVAVAEELLSAVSIKDSMVLADKAYGAFRLREYISTHQVNGDFNTIMLVQVLLFLVLPMLLRLNRFGRRFFRYILSAPLKPIIGAVCSAKKYRSLISTEAYSGVMARPV